MGSDQVLATTQTKVKRRTESCISAHRVARHSFSLFSHFSTQSNIDVCRYMDALALSTSIYSKKKIIPLSLFRPFAPTTSHALSMAPSNRISLKRRKKSAQALIHAIKSDSLCAEKALWVAAITAFVFHTDQSLMVKATN